MLLCAHKGQGQSPSPSLSLRCLWQASQPASRESPVSTLSHSRSAGATEMYRCAQLYMGCGASNSGPHACKANALPTKPLGHRQQSTPSGYSIHSAQEPREESFPRLLSHPYPTFIPHSHTPLPTVALVLTVLCDSAGLYPTVLYRPHPVCLPLCPAAAVRSGPSPGVEAL